MRLGLFVAAILLLGCGGAQTSPSFSNEDEPAIAEKPVCAAIGNGNTIACKPRRFGFSEEFGQQLTTYMPEKKKSVMLVIVGSLTDQQIGTKVQKYLLARGYDVKDPVRTYDIASGPLKYPFTLQQNGELYILTVAPSAR